MLEIILFLYGIGKQLAVEWDVLKGLTEPTDASSSQHTGCFCTIDGLARMFRVSIQVGESHYANDLFWQTKHFLFLVLLDLDATPGSCSRCG
jgi:hypothetical protein